MRLPLAVLLGALALAPSAAAHVPGTSIGQAVEVLRSVPVSHTNGAAVSELEADAFGRLPGVGDGIVVAALPRSTLRDVAGGAEGVAREIAREVPVRGTIIVLAGSELGAWSDRVPPARLRALVEHARTAQGSAAQVSALVSTVAAEPDPPPSGDGALWILVAAGLVALAATAVLALAVGRRRRAREASSRS